MKKATTDAVIRRDGLVCQYCGCSVIRGKTIGCNGLIIEHINGRNCSVSNLCVACRKCNSTKNRRTAHEWLVDIQKKIDMLVELHNKSERIKSLIVKLEAE